MEEYLKRPEIAGFLADFGYSARISLQEKLRFLGERISWFYNQSQEFPHETGVFLGYPLEDVKGFIRHGGKNYCEIGYWKVYSKAEQARETFRLYDEALNGRVFCREDHQGNHLLIIKRMKKENETWQK